MKMEICNVLIENRHNGPIEVGKLKKQIVSSGNRRLLSRLLWRTVGVSECDDA